MTQKEKIIIAELIGYTKIAIKYVPSNIGGFHDMANNTIRKIENILKK